MSFDKSKFGLAMQAISGFKTFTYTDTGGETLAEYGDTGFWQQFAAKTYGVDTGDEVLIRDVTNNKTYRGVFVTVNAQDTGGNDVALDTGSAAGV